MSGMSWIYNPAFAPSPANLYFAIPHGLIVGSILSPAHPRESGDPAPLMVSKNFSDFLEYAGAQRDCTPIIEAAQPAILGRPDSASYYLHTTH